MPRKSLAAIGTLPPLNVSRLRLTPPSWLSPAAANVFRTLVDAVDPAHFKRSDVPLLVAYCEATIGHDQAVQEIAAGGAVINGRPSPWTAVQERHVKALVALSRSLRLSPQSRMNSRQAERHHTAGIATELDWSAVHGGEDDEAK
jgi:P27 family predicted phage terminase small subunit